MENYCGSHTAAWHADLGNQIAGMPVYVSDYPQVGGKKKIKKKTKRKSTKVVKGAKYQSRPSASYFYNTLKKPLGYKISYRPRKGGKYILHSLQLRNNGVPYWKALEKLPKLSKKRTRKRKTN